MNKRNKFILAIVIAISVVGVLFTVVIPIGSDFHVESRAVKDDKFIIWVTNVEDCNVSISFVDDANLFYAFDVHLSSVAFGFSAFSVEENSYQVMFSGSNQVESVDVTLGSGMLYDIVVAQVWGSDIGLNTTITYSNGAQIDGVEVTIAHRGFLKFAIDEEVDATGDLDIRIGDSVTTTPSLVHLDIDLPTGMNGVVDFNDGSSLSILENTGWFLRQPPFDRIEYSTSASEPSPLLNLYAMQDIPHIVAWLSN